MAHKQGCNHPAIKRKINKKRKGAGATAEHGDRGEKTDAEL
jgi:hypothetical protein